MEQTYQYPNLLSGTRSGDRWKYSGPAGAGAVSYDKANNYLALQGTSKSEFFMSSPPVVLHKGIDYTLHCFAANTANMSSTELYVLDDAGYSSSYDWIGNHSFLTAPGPGGVAQCHVQAQTQFAGRRAIQDTLRQQRLHRRPELPHMVPRRHARGGHGAARMGTGRGGGVA